MLYLEVIILVVIIRHLEQENVVLAINIAVIIIVIIDILFLGCL